MNEVEWNEKGVFLIEQSMIDHAITMCSTALRINKTIQ